MQASENRSRVPLTVLLSAGLLLACACSVHEKKEGDNKRVDIQTPMGGMHVSTDSDTKDVGLALYPNSRPKPKKDHDESNANVNISTSFFGLKVVALTYLSDDSPEKLATFYKKELAKYGTVLECHNSSGTGNVSINKGKDKGKGEELHCENEGHGSTLELKVGTESRQHVVAIKPDGKGSEFSLVYVNARGKEDSI